MIDADRPTVRAEAGRGLRLKYREAQKKLRRSVLERKIDSKGFLHLKFVSSAFKHRLFTSRHFRTGFDTSDTVPAAIMTAEYEQEPIPVDEVYITKFVLGVALNDEGLALLCCTNFIVKQKKLFKALDL